MSDAPVQLRDVVQPNDDVISRLKYLTELATSGKLQHLSYIGTLTGNQIVDGHAGRTSDRYALAGMWLAQACNHARGFQP